MHLGPVRRSWVRGVVTDDVVDHDCLRCARNLLVGIEDAPTIFGEIEGRSRSSGLIPPELTKAHRRAVSLMSLRVATISK